MNDNEKLPTDQAELSDSELAAIGGGEDGVAHLTLTLADKDGGSASDDAAAARPCFI